MLRLSSQNRAIPATVPWIGATPARPSCQEWRRYRDCVL